jgi:hypothetical protein
LESATALIGDLQDFQGRLHPVGDVAHAQHFDFAVRALALRMFLRPALDLALQDEYVAAFALLRGALEHHLTDRLLFLARRYKVVFTKVKRAKYDQWVSEWKSKKPGTEDIVSLEWKNGTVVLIRTGLHPTGEKKGSSGRTISVYYFHLQDYDPFIGPPKDQRYLAREFMPVDQRVKYAEMQQQLYAQNISWDGIKRNLIYYRLSNAEMLRRFDVHYRFLSAFVHSIQAGFDLLYSRNRPALAPRYDHYASELVLLYINKIASEEIKVLKRMAARPPTVGLTDLSSLESHIKTADTLAAHLWFPGDSPHQFDYVEEANSRGLKKGKLVPMQGRLPPDQLKISQIRYYRNPLRRLIRMHQSFVEWTGFAYQSPWSRQDARAR